MVTGAQRSKLTVSPCVSCVDRVAPRADVQAARELVADYVRAVGVRDPDQIALLANQCVRHARKSGATGPALALLALRMTSSRLGLACAPRAAVADEPKAEHQLAHATLKVLSPDDVVPPCCPRVMPEQKLGELLPLAEPAAWRKVVRAGTTAIAFLMAKVRVV